MKTSTNLSMLFLLVLSMLFDYGFLFFVTG